MKIPFQSLKPRGPFQLNKLSRAARRVLKSGHYILGPEVRAFEKEFGESLGAENVVSTANGMDSIEIGLRSLGIGSGAEVITTPMTAFATILGIIRAGAIPVLCDIDPETALLDIEQARAKITPRTSAILIVHLYGFVHRVDEWQALADEFGLHLIEDCAQAHHARWEGQAAGTFGAFGAFSFYPTKNLGGFGDGGAITTKDAPLAALSRQLRNYGQRDRYSHAVMGSNSRMDEIQAALLRINLAGLDRDTRKRRAIAERYRNGIHNPAVRLLESPRVEENHSYHLFVVCATRRDDLQKFLLEKKVETLIHYPVPAHRQKAWEQWSVTPLSLPHSERFAAEVLSLPCHPRLSSAAVDHVIASVNAFPR